MENKICDNQGELFQTSKANEHIVNQIDVNKVSDVAGAEILNINLSKPLPKFALEKIMKAFTQHHVLIFRQQNLSKIEQESFTQNFGEIEGHVGRLPNGQRLPNVHTVTNIDNLTGKPPQPHILTGTTTGIRISHIMPYRL